MLLIQKRTWIYALQSIQFLNIVHGLVLSHLGSSVQLYEIHRQIIWIQMVLVMNLLADVFNETAYSSWMKAQIYRLYSFSIPNWNHVFLPSHYENCLQSFKFDEQIHVIQMVLATGWYSLNWQSEHPSLHPCI